MEMDVDALGLRRGATSSVSILVGKIRAKGKDWKRGRGGRMAGASDDGERRLGSSISVRAFVVGSLGDALRRTDLGVSIVSVSAVGAG